MGLYILSYGIDLQKIRQLLSSNDEEAFEAIIATEVFDNYAQQDFKGLLTTKEALRHLIFGETYDAKSAHAYGYALIGICDYLGVDLGGAVEFKLGYVTDLVDQYLASDFSISDVLSGEDLFGHDLNLGLPPVTDFPASGYLTNADLQVLYKELKHIQIDDQQVDELIDSDSEEDEEKGVAYEAIKSFKSRIDYCHQNQLQLVSFCH